jgi:RHS repeat-associated protein
MTLLSRVRRSTFTVMLTLVTFVAASVPVPAFADDTPVIPNPNGPGSPVFGVPASGGQQAAGALASVDLATGVAHSSVPFQLPAARGKVQPGLSLKYSSMSGQGEAGIGWRLDVPAIERHNDAGPPLYQDPNPGKPLDPTKEDHFTFAGQPIVPICLVGASVNQPGLPSRTCATAAPGETMPAWANGWHYFRLEADTSFARFFWSPGHETWVVQQKSGETMEFGTPQDDPTGETGAGNDFDTSLTSNPTFRWRLVRRYDAMGPSMNVIYYRWQNASLFLSASLTGDVGGNAQFHYLTDIYDTPQASATMPGAAGGKAPIPFSAFAHHVHINWTPDDTVTPNAVQMPNPMNAALVWRAIPTLLVSRVDVTSAMMTSATRQLVRSYQLEYFARGAGAAHFQRSLLKSVQMTGGCAGYTEAADGTIAPPPATIDCPGGALPATTMTYTGIDQPPVVALNAFSGSLPIISFGGTLMDADGDGLPDVVGPGLYCPGCTTPGGGSFVALAQPILDATPTIDMSVSPVLGATQQNLLGCANPFGCSQQWAVGNWTADYSGTGGSTALWWDANADQYQVFTAHIPGHGASGTWLADARHSGKLPPHTGLAASAPPSPLASFADIDGDGLLDWIHQDPTTGQVSAFYTTQSSDGTVQPLGHTITGLPIMPLPAAPIGQSFFVDANGDGVPDLITLGPLFTVDGQERVALLVFRGHGDATFDNDSEFPYQLGVLPENISSEIFGNTAQIYLHDINGDGIADVVTYDAAGLRTFFSTGRSLIEGPNVGTDLVPGYPSSVQIGFADMEGSGVDNIVTNFVEFGLLGDIPIYGGSYMRYVALFDRQPQALLSTVSNGLGATTSLGYVYSVASDATINPQVLFLVASITTTLSDPSGLSGGPYQTQYDYVARATPSGHFNSLSSAVYDPRYRSFVGFDHVRTIQVKAPFTTSLTNSLITDTYFQLNNSCPTCSELDEPIRAIRGLPVYTIVSDPQAQGNFLSATHHQYRLEPLYTGMDGRQTRYAYPELTDTWLFDSSAVSTGTTTITPLDVDDDEGASNPQSETRNGSYPFPTIKGSSNEDTATATVRLQTTQVVDLYGNVTSSVDKGIISGAPVDTPITQTTKWPNPGGSWIWRATDATTSGSGGSRHYELLYDSLGNLTDVSADITGVKALNRFHESPSAMIAKPPANAEFNGTRQLLTHIEPDAFGNMLRVVSNGGEQCSAFTYDTSFQQLVTAKTLFLNGCSSPNPLTTMQSYDRRFAVVTQSIGPDRAVTRRTLDLFGRVHELFLPDPNTPGMTETDANTIASYPITPGGPFQVVQTQQRDDDGGGSATYRSSWALIDPLGRTAATVADAGKGDPLPRIVSGMVKRDGVGLVAEAYTPFFSSYMPVSSGLPKPTSTAFKFDHDAFRRTTETFKLDETPGSKAVYHAVSRELYDASDLVGTPYPLSTRSDGHGRTVEIRQPTGSGGASGHSKDIVITMATYAPTGEITGLTRTHSAAADKYARTMSYDSLGRMVANAEPNTSTPGAEWVYAYDLAGNLVGTSDARGCGVNYAYDGAGRVAYEDYSPCLNAQPGYTSPKADGDGTEAFFHYDTPESLQTGDYGPNPVFLEGRLAAVSDRGQHSRYGYDGRGRLVGTAKQVAQPGAESLLALSERYAPSWYRTATAYDEAGRSIAQTTGAEVDGLQGTSTTVGSLTGTDLLTTTYDARDTPIQVGGSYGSLVSKEIRTADGLLSSRVYGDAASTTASYNYNTNRWITEAQLSRKAVAPELLLDAAYVNYDAVGNARIIQDNRDYHDWPDGAQPVNKNLHYDDLDRLRSVNYEYKHDSSQTPLFAPTDLSPMPLALPLTRVGYQDYDYDWQDNLVSSRDNANAFFVRSVGTATYGTPTSGPNQVHSVSAPGGSATISYDAAGNMTSFLEDWAFSTPTFHLTYQWDEAGQLSGATRVDYDGPTETQTTSLSYTYDASGQRVSRSVQVGGGIFGGSEYFLEIFPSLRINGATWDYTVGDYNRDDTTETAYLMTNGASYGRVVYDDSVPMTGPTPQHVYLQMTDALGSTSTTIDRASGTLVEQATYLAYGGEDSDYRAPGWDSFRESYRYTGKEDDYQVGLTYFGQRYYCAALGRWASADPLNIHSLGGDPNPYGFVRGSPLRFVDPIGLDVGALTYSDPSDDAPPVTETPTMTISFAPVAAAGSTGTSSGGSAAEAFLGLTPDLQAHLDSVIAQAVFDENLQSLLSSAIVGDLPSTLVSPAAPGDFLFNPYAQSAIDTILLSSSTPDYASQQLEAQHSGFKIFTPLGSLETLVSTRATGLQRALAVVGLVTSAIAVAGQLGSVGSAATEGVEGAANGVASDARLFQSYRAQLAQEEIEGADAVGSALKADPYHRSASFATGGISSGGRVFSLANRTGRVTLTQMVGEMNGVPGRFEWIVDAEGNLTHELFVEGGRITGIPIKP